jgi:hypothetical protein
LKITGNTDRKSGVSATRSITALAATASGLCPVRASARASLVDDYVEGQVLDALHEEGGLLAQAVDASEAIEAAARAVAEAEHELDLFVTNPKLLTLLGEEKFVEGVETRQRALDTAHQTLAEVRQQSGLAQELAKDGDLLEAWPTLSVQEKRRLMHGLLDRVVVTRASRATVRRLIPSRCAISRCETLFAANARTCAHFNALRTSAPPHLSLDITDPARASKTRRTQSAAPRVVHFSITDPGAVLGCARVTQLLPRRRDVRLGLIRSLPRG